MKPESYRIETLPKPRTAEETTAKPTAIPKRQPKPRAAEKACRCGKTELANEDCLTGIGGGLICGLCLTCGDRDSYGRFIGGRHSLIRQRIPPMTQTKKGRHVV